MATRERSYGVYSRERPALAGDRRFHYGQITVLQQIAVLTIFPSAAEDFNGRETAGVVSLATPRTPTPLSRPHLPAPIKLRSWRRVLYPPPSAPSQVIKPGVGTEIQNHRFNKSIDNPLTSGRDFYVRFVAFSALRLMSLRYGIGPVFNARMFPLMPSLGFQIFRLCSCLKFYPSELRSYA